LRFFFSLFLFCELAFGDDGFSPKGLTAIWDTTTAAGILNGGGTWDSSLALWNFDGVGAANSRFCPGCNVSFGRTGSTGPAGTVTVTGTQFINSMTFDPVGSGNYTLSGGELSCVNALSCTYTANVSGTIGSLISGSKLLLKEGTQTLTLSGANTYTGNTTISKGTLATTNNNSLGSSTGTTTLGDANTGANNITLTTSAGSLTQSIFTVPNQGSGTVTFEGTVQNAGFVGNIALNRAATFQANYAGVGGAYFGAFNNSTVTSGNVGTLTVKALQTGVAYMPGNNTFVGSVSLPQGGVYTFHNGAFGGSGNSVTMSGTSLLGLYGANLTIGDLTGASGNSVDNDVSGTNTLTISSANSATFAGVISGAGALTKSGMGTQTLSGNNTYTGNTTINGGTLYLGNGTTTNNIIPATNLITNDSILIYNTPSTISHSGIISGTGSFEKLGTGVLTLSGVNSYLGGTTVSAGTLQETTTVSAFPGNVSIAAGATAWLNVTGAQTHSNTFTGAGTLKATAGGTGSTTTSLSGNLSGLTGTLEVNPFGGGGGKVNITTGTQANTMPAGSLVRVQSGGTIYLPNALNYAAGVQLNGGTTGEAIGNLRVEGNATVTGPISLLTNSTIGTYVSTGYISGVISGVGFGFTKESSGNLILTNNNTYTGTTTITGGTLTLGDGTAGGNIIPATNLIADNAALVYNTGSNIPHSGVISGTGTLTKQGNGTLTLSAVNTYTGATTVSNGTLGIINTPTTQTTMSTSGITVASGATLSINRTTNIGSGNATNYNNLSGAGSVIHNGTNSTTSLLVNGGWTLWNGTVNLTGSIDVQTGVLASQAGASWTGTTASLNVASGAQFLVHAADAMVDELTGAGTIGTGWTTAQTLTVGNGNSSGTFSGVIAGNGVGSNNVDIGAGVLSLTKTGTGTQTLTGINTYTGATTISGGTLQISSSGNLGSGSYAGAISNSGTFQYSSSATQTLSGVISGAGTFTKDTSTTSTLTLSGANTYTGTTNANAGTLKLTNTNTSPTFNIASGAVLELDTTSGTRNSGTQTFNGTGTLRKTGANSAVWGGSVGTFALGSGSLIDIQGGVFTGGSSANENWTNNLSGLNVATGAIFNGVEENIRVDALTGNGTITSGLVHGRYTIGFTFGVDGGSGTFSGVIANTDASNAGKYTKEGAGTQILTGVNTYTGNTSINGGILQISGAGSLASSYAGAISIASGATLKYSSSADQILNGVISGAGNIVKDTSTSTLTANGNNTLTGTVTLDAGTFRVNYPGAVGSAITVKSGTTLFLDENGDGLNIWSAPLTFTGPDSGTDALLFFDSIAGGLPDHRWSGAITLNTPATFTSTMYARPNYITGVISGASPLTVNGGMVQIHQGASTYSGGTILQSGTLRGDIASAFGTGTITLGNANSGTNAMTLQLNAANINNDITVSTSGTGTKTIYGTVQYQSQDGTITVPAGATVRLQVFDNNGGDWWFNFGGKLTGAGTVQFVADNTPTASRMYFGDSTSDFTGDAVLVSGRVQIGMANVLGTGSADLDTGTSGTSDLRLWSPGTYTVPVNMLSGSGAIYNDGGGTATLSVGNNNGSSTYSGVISQNVALAKEGTGTLTLSGQSTYTRGTTVNGGTLSLAGGGGATTSTIKGDLIINSGGTVSAPTPWTFGYSDSATEAVKSITINGGTLNFTGSDSGGGMNSTIAMTNGSITGSIFDYYMPSGARTITINAGTSTISGGMDHRIPGGLTFDVAAGGTLNYSGRLRQEGTPGAVIKAGPGLMNMTGVNTYTVPTTISAGTFQISGAGSLGSGSYAGDISNSGIFKYSSSANQTLSGGMSGTGALIKDTSNSTLTLSGTGVTYSGATTISAGTLSLVDTTATFGAGGFTVNNGTTLNLNAPADWATHLGINGTITGTGLITKTGTGKIKFGCSKITIFNLGVGAVTDVQGGILQADCVKNGYGANLGSLNIATGATMDVYSDTSQYDALTGAGTLTNGYVQNGVKTVTLGVSNTTNNATYGVANNTATFSGVIDNAGGNINIVKTGTGTQILSGANTWSGSTTVSGGTLKLQDTAGYKTTNLIVNTGGTLQIDFITGGNASTTPARSFETVVANVTGAGTVSYSCPTGKFCSSGYAAGELNNNLSANGQINILSGSMQWGWDHGSHLTNLGSLDVAANSEFRTSNAIFQFDKITGSGIIGNAYNTAVTLRIGVNNGTSTFSGSIRNGDSYNNVTTGALTLVKQGTGTITLNGASTYTGGTTISTGRIICGVAGALGTGTVAVSAGAIFTKGPCTNATSGAGTVN
jgi:fibronectin-binding autotransporter adhesin